MERNCSLFIGRFQPLHDGHVRLIGSAIDEGKDVCVAIRDTKRSEDNPFSYRRRRRMVKKALPMAKVIRIPDISEVCYGRKVGYGIREIRLDRETESISATNIRKGWRTRSR